MGASAANVADDKANKTALMARVDEDEVMNFLRRFKKNQTNHLPANVNTQRKAKWLQAIYFF
jgi:hypothetical protein